MLVQSELHHLQVTSTKTIFEKTMFDQGGDKGGLPQVEPNVQLVNTMPRILPRLEPFFNCIFQSLAGTQR